LVRRALFRTAATIPCTSGLNRKIIPALAGTKSGAIEGVARAGELRNKTSMETDARGSDASENLRL
jgi:hypothetical protein